MNFLLAFLLLLAILQPYYKGLAEARRILSFLIIKKLNITQNIWYKENSKKFPEKFYLFMQIQYKLLLLLLLLLILCFNKKWHLPSVLQGNQKQKKPKDLILLIHMINRIGNSLLFTASFKNIFTYFLACLRDKDCQSFMYCKLMVWIIFKHFHKNVSPLSRIPIETKMWPACACQSQNHRNEEFDRIIAWSQKEI
jgi:hypothetical protein